MTTDDARTSVTSPQTPAHARISQRVGAIQPSATLAVDSTAKALKAAGRPVIGFGAGEPDFPTPQHIVDAAVEAAQDPRNHRYSATGGLPELKQALAESFTASTGLEVEPAQVLVTNGGKQAVFQAFATLLDPGDEVILPAPYWTTYPEAIRQAGATEVPVLAGVDQGYVPTVAQLEAARTENTRALLLCSPSNPTGVVLTPEQVEEIGRWALEHGIWVVTDEIYQALTYDGMPFTSVLKAVPELAETTVLLGGVAKSFAMTGWRVGWMVGPADVIKAATNLQSHLTSHVNNIAQQAALAALTGSTAPVEEMREAFDRRRRLIVEKLSEVPGFTVPTPTGAFYAFPDVSGVLGRTIRGREITSSTELATVILEEAEVAAVPGEAFGAPGHLRFSYALNDDDIVEGIGRVAALLSE
ncbi:pyridoxal phosphate-dependent aminotransferase [Brachybacterium saurashtrense]|uniref:Aminotransferase n=1 Tax=Brachybacterium saurashtrense TaxID=556288 RepID=A0A345YPG7_9MICO|nr:pyridoxal phosphate-dependent aminotransferase [Brachybacterium saurashtrense]AXK45819.1 pyridoxal phosphate-dependent aminotransferase [Brachybacterium saurashtrense]RRR24838.1 pyridoxal phosphate-dependent aminotransferase [Brachybacterium saurashtrense]